MMHATPARRPSRWMSFALFVLALLLASAPLAAQTLLDPTSLTKYVDPLPIPGAMPMAGPNYYEIGAYEIHQQLHSQLPPTYLFGYGVSQETASYPAATIVAQRGVPIDIRWTNHLGFNHPVSFAFDPTIEHAITTTGIPITPHVHGAEVEPQSDGGPMTWFTNGFAETGPDWTKEVYHYANTQLASTIWYHDHAFGFTRHNVYAGLAGYYIVQDPANEPAGLPSGAYEVPLAIQDKMFQADGQLWYPNEGDNPEHPIWTPEFFGNVILVNGKIWPYLNVEPRKYRFRMLNGSNARFYSLSLNERITSSRGPAFYQIGTDGGYLNEPVLLNDPNSNMSPRLLLAPGERADIVIDFSAYAPGTEFLLKNVAKAPYPNGDVVDPQTTGQIMLLRVVPSTGPDTSILPAQLASVPRLSNPVRTRTMTLNEQMGAEGPLGAFLNGTPYMAAVTELPALGTTEMWEVVNLTGDAHPIHLHLVQFQLLNRQKVNVRRYQNAFDAANGMLPVMSYTPVPVGPYLKGKPAPADPNERGWKDTYRVNPGEVARFLIRFAPQDDSPSFAFDATAEPGYVWHCHILEHEENDMMRPYKLVAPSAAIAVADAMQAAAEAAAAARTPSLTTRLRGSVPNPSADGGTIRFSVRNAGPVELELFSVDGRLVRRLASGWHGAGEHGVAWQRHGADGPDLANGIYLVRFRGDGVTESQKLVLFR
ncbi:MAG TPA: multicopper oxidase domain-containing protein [Candidatus Eisenbacteria bacterium]|nr:multicopper oxidase domain-containing protein [Candidatus Eisenbacteria bacterium]